MLEYNGSTGLIGNWYTFALAAAFGPDAVLNQMNVTNSTRGTLNPDVLGSVIGSLDAASGEFTKTGYQTYGENPSLALRLCLQSQLRPLVRTQSYQMARSQRLHLIYQIMGLVRAK